MEPTQAGNIGARLDRLPATRSIWVLVGLLSLGGFFEFYDLFFTGYVAPGLMREHILTPTTPGLFGTTGIAGFIAALFSGLFIGTMAFGFVADRFGRRTIFTFSLLWYSAASIIMALQTDATSLLLWRFIAGVGIGVELVTIDTYISEFVPKGLRGRAFAFNQTIQFAVVPVVAFPVLPARAARPVGLRGVALGRHDWLGGGARRVVHPPRRAGKPTLAGSTWPAARGGKHRGGAGGQGAGRAWRPLAADWRA